MKLSRRHFTALSTGLILQSAVPPRAFAQSGTAAKLAAAPSLAGVSPEDIGELAKLYEAALASGKTTVNFYSANAPVDPNTSLGISFREFEKTFPGITVLGTRISGTELNAKLQGEIASGNRQADLISGPEDYIDQGLIQSYRPPLARNVPKRYWQTDGDFVSSSQKLFGLVYNTSLVKPDEIPHSLDDMLVDKWKGKITLTQPTGTGTTDRAISILLESNAIDAATLKKLADFVPTKDRQELASASVNLVAQGRFAFSIWAPNQVAAQIAERGGPVGAAKWKEGVLISSHHGLLVGAPAPDAAKLLLNWLFTPTGQRIYAEKVYEYGTVPGAPIPTGLPDLSDYNYAAIPETEARDRAIKRFEDVVEPIFGTPK